MSITAGITAAKASLESDLRRQLDDRETRKALDADMEFRTDGDFWVRKSEIDKTLIPYCPACWGKDGKLVAMAPYSNPGIFRCPLHEKRDYPTDVDRGSRDPPPP